MEPVTEWLHSKSNELFFQIRNRLRFSRRGYSESLLTEPDAFSTLSAEEKALLSLIRNMAPHLSEAVLKKNLYTLWLLKSVFPAQLLSQLKSTEKPIHIVEPGCQDFNRLPALHSFFPSAQITGIELDAYPILHDLHSRADKARYYISLTQGSHTFEAADFFQWQQVYDLALCFYPFVSPSPALAWGLPARYGNAANWLHALTRSVRSQGYIFLVHQGCWEEGAFDEVRLNLSQSAPFSPQAEPTSLVLEYRKQFSCSFYPLPYPAYVSLYRKVGSGNV